MPSNTAIGVAVFLTLALVEGRPGYLKDQDRYTLTKTKWTIFRNAWIMEEKRDTYPSPWFQIYDLINRNVEVLSKEKFLPSKSFFNGKYERPKPQLQFKEYLLADSATNPSTSGGASRSPKPSSTTPPSTTIQSSESPKPSTTTQPTSTIKTSESPKPSSTNLPSTPIKTSASPKPISTTQPTTIIKTSESPKASTATLPTTAIKTSESIKPSTTTLPTTIIKTSESPKPSTTTPPSTTIQSSASPKPSSTTQPTTIIKTSESPKPSTTTLPTTAIKTSASPKPSSTTLPTTIIKTSESPKPSTTTLPTTAIKTSASPKPSSTTLPTTIIKTSESPKPSTTTLPTTTIKTSASPKPSSTTLPTTTIKISEWPKEFYPQIDKLTYHVPASLKWNISYSPDLGKPSSKIYQDYSEAVKAEVTQVFGGQNSAFKGVNVAQFTKGSVVANFHLLFNLEKTLGNVTCVDTILRKGRKQLPTVQLMEVEADKLYIDTIASPHILREQGKLFGPTFTEIACNKSVYPNMCPPSHTCHVSAPQENHNIPEDEIVQCRHICLAHSCSGLGASYLTECYLSDDYVPNCRCSHSALSLEDRCVDTWDVFGPVLAIGILFIAMVTVIIAVKWYRKRNHQSEGEEQSDDLQMGNAADPTFNNDQNNLVEFRAP